MPFCKNCGSQVEDFHSTCPECGASLSQGQRVTDTGGFGWGLLGFCIPLVGLILFLVWKDEKPNSAKAAGIGALISVILGVFGYILMFIAMLAV